VPRRENNAYVNVKDSIDYLRQIYMFLIDGVGAGVNVSHRLVCIVEVVSIL